MYLLNRLPRFEGLPIIVALIGCSGCVDSADSGTPGDSGHPCFDFLGSVTGEEYLFTQISPTRAYHAPAFSVSEWPRGWILGRTGRA